MPIPTLKKQPKIEPQFEADAKHAWPMSPEH
ncbi:Uncharacterised protein [Burkholderia pseudomallei]|nr:Uncharacterised protein [Burkholderia pseudomallei]